MEHFKNAPVTNRGVTRDAPKTSANIGKQCWIVSDFVSESRYFQELKHLWIKSRSGLGAGEGNRTLVLSLGSSRSTIELHPHRDRITPKTPCRQHCTDRLGSATIVAHLIGSATQNNGLTVGTPLLSML